MAKILIVDDSAIPRMVFRKMLESSGYQTVEAADGAAAVAAYQHEHPDLVVLDLLLKDESGFEVLRQLRALNPGVRVIISTGEADDATRRLALEAGAHAFLRKPFTAEQALAVVESLAGPPARSVLKLERLHDSCMADPDTERECLDRLTVSAHETLVHIDAALDAGDGARVHADAHALMGSCLMLGAEALGETCAVLEKAASHGDLARARALLTEAKRELERLREAVKVFLSYAQSPDA